MERAEEKRRQTRRGSGTSVWLNAGQSINHNHLRMLAKQSGGCEAIIAQSPSSLIAWFSLDLIFSCFLANWFARLANFSMARGAHEFNSVVLLFRSHRGKHKQSRNCHQLTALKPLVASPDLLVASSSPLAFILIESSCFQKPCCRVEINGAREFCGSQGRQKQA